jgi:tetratricopeptide (TPR) repeat protein
MKNNNSVQPQHIKGNRLLFISKGKRLYFYLLLILIPVILFVLLEIGLRMFHYGYDLRLFNKSTLYPGYYEINNNVGKRYFTKFEATNPPNDIFLINKPDTCFRIFVMGESTTEGFPYHSGTTFSRILNYRLQDAFPHKRIEVVNTGMSAVNSFTLVDLTDEIIKQKPDLIIIYTGHNEYYGALGVGSVENGGNVRWLKILHLKLVHLRIFQLLQKIVGDFAKLFTPNRSENGTLMERIVKDKSIGLDSKLFNEGLEQFRANMSEIVEKAKKAEVPVILSEQVCNVRDQKPFKSIKIKGFPEADNVFDEAIKSESKGDYKKARELYYKAKDLDAIRFRAPEALNGIIIEIGKKYNVAVVPMKMYFEKKSPNGLIGDNLMLEHLHPNLNGYFLMADAFFNSIRKERLISDVWDSTLIKPKEYYRNNWGFTLLDSLVGNIRIKTLKNGWPFKPEATVNNFLNTYHPVSYEDSVALNNVKFKTHIEDEHLNMAKHYASRGDNAAAYNEYYAMIKNYPHVNELYYEAIIYLYACNDYKRALDLMLSLPDKDTCFFALLQIGQIYSKLNMPKKAISIFNTARLISKPGDNIEPLLIDLFKEYKQTGNEEKEKQLITQIHAIDPQFNLENNVTTKEILENQEVKKLTDQAMLLGKHGNFDKALEVLYKSVKIKETGLANQLIGSIFFQRKDMKALFYFEKANKENPSDPDILNNLFILYLMKKDFEKASKCLGELKQSSTNYKKIERLEKLLNNSVNKSN